MAISAQQVKELREKTGAGMMECKKALEEANGNLEEAITILRKRGLASAAKKAGRITSEGLVEVSIAAVNGKSMGAIVEVNCETDFVARTDDFKNFVSQVALHVLNHGPHTLQELLGQKISDRGTQPPAWLVTGPSIVLLGQKISDHGTQTLKGLLAERIAHIGENLSIRRFDRFELQGSGALGKYIHAGGKIGVLVEMGGSSGMNAEGEDFQSLIHEVAMHVAASDPKYLSRHEVESDVLAREKDIARAKVPPGKPAPVVEKIVEGQLGKFYGEVCLLEQPFIKDPAVTVGQWLSQKASALKGSFEIRRFVRYKAGEGIDKRDDDFAAEVAAQLK